MSSTPAVLATSNPETLARSVGRAGLVLTIIAGYLGLTATGAFAQEVGGDPTGGMFTTLQSQLTGTVIPAAAALIVVALVFGMAVKWVSKSSKKS